MRYEINETTKTIMIKDRISLRDIIKFAKKRKFNLDEWELISQDNTGIWTIPTYKIDTYPSIQPYDFTVTSGTNWD